MASTEPNVAATPDKLTAKEDARSSRLERTNSLKNVRR
jgi:hypothetical protein